MPRSITSNMIKPGYTREEFLTFCITPATSSPFISTECSICQEPYCDSTDGCAVTFSDKDTCNHVFCRACITTWLSEKSVNTCALCRRVLFALEDPPSMYDDEYDSSDDDDDDDEDYVEEEGYSEDEELDPLLNSELDIRDLDILPLRMHTTDRNYILPGQIILEILENIWFKTWWLLSCYRCYVSHARKRSLCPSPWCLHCRITDAQVKTLLPGTICLVHALFHTIRAVVGVDSIHLYGDHELKVIAWLVNDIAASLKAHIDVTDGSNCVPDFPLWRMRIWGEPLQWLLALPEGSEYTRAPPFLLDQVYRDLST